MKAMVVDLMVKPDFDLSMKCILEMPFTATEVRLYGHEMAGKQVCSSHFMTIQLR